MEAKCGELSPPPPSPPALTTFLRSTLPHPPPLQESLSASEAKCGELTREMTELRAALEATGRAAAEDVRAAKVGMRGGGVEGGRFSRGGASWIGAGFCPLPALFPASPHSPNPSRFFSPLIGARTAGARRGGRDHAALPCPPFPAFTLIPPYSPPPPSGAGAGGARQGGRDRALQCQGGESGDAVGGGAGVVCLFCVDACSVSLLILALTTHPHTHTPTHRP